MKRRHFIRNMVAAALLVAVPMGLAPALPRVKPIWEGIDWGHDPSITVAWYADMRGVILNPAAIVRLGEVA